MIYIHVPFCRSFCTYCDFYSEIAGKGHDPVCFENYLSKLLSEIKERVAETAAAAKTDTLYIGGGTPSVLPLSAIESIVSALGGSPFEEFTIEVNPEDVLEKGESYLKGLRELGVNRISMGVQSLDDSMLIWMNRRHDSKAAISAFRTLRAAGFDNISVDVIFGISHLSDKSLVETLDGLLDMRPEHLSAYQLSIEEGSALAKMLQDGRYSEAEEGQCAAQYELICKRLREAGYEHYEISNWALPGRRAIHNSAYWSRDRYVGFGPGAHSFDGRVRSWNGQSLSLWKREYELLTEEDARIERVMLGLRTSEGIPESLCDSDKVEALLQESVLIRTGDAKIRIPESSFFISDSIIERLI